MQRDELVVGESKTTPFAGRSLAGVCSAAAAVTWNQIIISTHNHSSTLVRFIDLEQRGISHFL